MGARRPGRYWLSRSSARGSACVVRPSERAGRTAADCRTTRGREESHASRGRPPTIREDRSTRRRLCYRSRRMRRARARARPPPGGRRSPGHRSATRNRYYRSARSWPRTSRSGLCLQRRSRDSSGRLAGHRLHVRAQGALLTLAAFRPDLGEAGGDHDECAHPGAEHPLGGLEHMLRWQRHNRQVDPVRDLVDRPVGANTGNGFPVRLTG